LYIPSILRPIESYNLLSDLSFSAPLIARLGGDDALRETIEAIKDVGRWWPQWMISPYLLAERISFFFF
jgi:hypothetical protein